MASLIGEVIGNCRLEALIGAGGMGEVYRARHIYLGREQAVKLLAPDLVENQALRDAFRREARLAASLNHPHIVRVFDSGEWHGRGYLVMEYLSGSSVATLLEQLTRSGRRMPLELALDLARQAADGLAFAHRFGVVHSDITLANLLLQRDDTRAGRPLLKIGDFGLAHLADEMLAVGGLSGTPAYLAPEQCRGEPAEPRSDIYSLGMALYEMIAGRPAFQAPSYTELMVRQIQSQPIALRQFRPELDRAVENLVLSCLAKEPGQRPASADDLARALDRLLQHSSN